MERLLPGNWDGTTRRLRSLGVYLVDSEMNPALGDNDDVKTFYVFVKQGGYLTTARHLVFFQGKENALRVVAPEDGPFEFPEDGFIFLNL